ncbi:MAG: DUF4157 domain-containing protein [Persicimonas sp.]
MTLERRLTEVEENAILQALDTAQIAGESVCRQAVRDCVLIRRTPLLAEICDLRSGVAYAALKTRASGITLGNQIFIRREFFADDGDIPLDLLAHEVAHVVQFLRDGTVPFLWRYLRDYTLGLTRGLGDRNAYMAIPYEVEARRVADVLDLPATGLHTPDVQPTDVQSSDVHPTRSE